MDAQTSAHVVGLRELEQTAGIDPRPDLAEDHLHWTVLLHYAKDSVDDPELEAYHILRGVRCLGARLQYQNSTLHILRSAEIEIEEWRDIRARYMIPMREALSLVLTRTAEKMREENYGDTTSR